MKKHEHDWQYQREVYVDEWDRITSFRGLESGSYFKFVCHCGASKVVKEIKE